MFTYKREHIMHFLWMEFFAGRYPQQDAFTIMARDTLYLRLMKSLLTHYSSTLMENDFGVICWPFNHLSTTGVVSVKGSL